MKNQIVNINGHEVTLTIHYIGNEVSEVYAMIDDMELEFAYDLEDMIEKLNNSAWLQKRA